MANSIASPKDDDLEVFQAGLRSKLRYASSFFSIVLIIAGLYLLLNGLFGLAVKNGNSDNSELDEVAVTTENDPQITDGEIDGAASTGRVTAATLSAIEKSDANVEVMKKTGHWIATDYAKGDIGLGEYIVRSGDTLWEIAEAVYGSGFEWHKVLDNNRDLIGYLPDGSQALIFPGQVLKLVK